MDLLNFMHGNDLHYIGRESMHVKQPGGQTDSFIGIEAKIDQPPGY